MTYYIIDKEDGEIFHKGTLEHLKQVWFKWIQKADLAGYRLDKRKKCYVFKDEFSGEVSFKTKSKKEAVDWWFSQLLNDVGGYRLISKSQYSRLYKK